MDLEQLLFTRLSGGASLTSLLSTYGGSPAIFLGSRVPADATTPFLWSPPNVSDLERGSKTGGAREISRLLNAYCEESQPDTILVAILKEARALLNRAPLTGGIVSEITGPASVPAGEGLKGMGMTLRHWHEEE